MVFVCFVFIVNVLLSEMSLGIINVFVLSIRMLFDLVFFIVESSVFIFVWIICFVFVLNGVLVNVFGY